jgi:hypothetical protein
MAISNTIADASIRKYILQNREEKSLVAESGNAIEFIKSQCKEIDISYKDRSIYKFTEAEIEYYETLSLLNENKETEAYLKILDATESYYQATKNASQINRKFLSFEAGITELRNQILAKRGILRI